MKRHLISRRCDFLQQTVNAEPLNILPRKFKAIKAFLCISQLQNRKIKFHQQIKRAIAHTYALIGQQMYYLY